MKTLQIKTAQNVNINFAIANIGQRLLAFLADNVLKFGYIYFVFYILKFNAFQNITQGDSWTEKAISVLILCPVTFYSLYSEILLNGQTLGKKLLKIKIITLQGFKPSISDYLIRWFLRIVDFNLFILLVIYTSSLGIEENDTILGFIFLAGKMIGLLLIVFTNKNQRFGDVIANTVVISLKDEVAFSDTILENLETSYKPTYANVIKLSDNDARIIKDTFKNAVTLNDYKTLIKLRTKILEVTQIVSVHNSDKEFIEAVLKDYNFYTQDM